MLGLEELARECAVAIVNGTRGPRESGVVLLMIAVMLKQAAEINEKMYAEDAAKQAEQADASA